MRLFFLQPSPLLYSPEGLHLDSRFNTRVIAREDPNEDGVIDRVKILRTNGMMIEYELDEGSSDTYSPADTYQS